MNKNSLALFIIFIPFFGLSQLENVWSKLEIFNIQNGIRETIYKEFDHFEAPNWSKDGSFIILNGKGKIFRFDLTTKKKTYINTDFADKLNNDHGISPDGKKIVISHYDQPNVDYKDRDFKSSRIYTLPIEGGIPSIVTEKTPSFWYRWSPDGQTLIYTALRNDNLDIYAINEDGVLVQTESEKPDKLKELESQKELRYHMSLPSLNINPNELREDESWFCFIEESVPFA